MKKVILNKETIYINVNGINTVKIYKAKSEKFWINIEYQNGGAKNVGSFESEEKATEFCDNLFS